MKISSFLFVFFLLFSSLAYSDIVSDLQAKKNNTKETGIFYTILPGEYVGKKPVKYIITEKEDNKLIESSLFQEQMYLLCNGNLYRIPSSAEVSPLAPTTVTLLTKDMKKNLEENTKKFNIPDYTNAKIIGPAKINGYRCQVLQKTISDKERKDKNGAKYKEKNLLNIYVIEKNGYPTRIENVFRTENLNGEELSNEVKNTIDFVKFSTKISSKVIELPVNAIIVDAVNSLEVFDRETHKKKTLKKK